MTTIDIAIVVLYAVGPLASRSGYRAMTDKIKPPKIIFMVGHYPRRLALADCRQYFCGTDHWPVWSGLRGWFGDYTEWQAAIVLLIVAKYFLPIFLKRFTPCRSSFRHGMARVKSLMSFYWIVLYTAVNLPRCWVWRPRYRESHRVDVYRHVRACWLCGPVFALRRTQSCSAHRHYSSRHSYPRWLCHYMACARRCGFGRGRLQGCSACLTRCQATLS